MDRIKKMSIAAAFALIGAFALGTAATAQHGGETKVLLIVLEPPDARAGFAKVMAALEYARQLKVSAVETELVFDGAGVQWLTYLENLPDSMLLEDYKTEEWKQRVGPGKKRRFAKLMSALKAAGLRPAATRAGAEMSDMVGALDAAGVRWAAEKGDFDIIKYVNGGYRVWIF